MEILTPPEEIISQAVINILKKHEEMNPEKFNKLLKGYKKRILIKTDLYPILLEFDDGKIKAHYVKETEKADFSLFFYMETLLALAEGRLNAISAFLGGKIKLSPILKIFSVLKVYRILFPPITSKKKELGAV